MARDSSEPQLPLDGPLRGIRVIELGHIFNGPYAGMLLAYAGAEVIKVEPVDGEHLRRRANAPGAHQPFVMVNSNKLGITLNLKDPRGAGLLQTLIQDADVLIENFAPGVMERLGFGRARVIELNPRIVFASGSGYGQSGPYKDYPAMDVTVQAMAGVIGTTGFPDQPPVKAGPALADFLGGAHLFGGIVTALYGRDNPRGNGSAPAIEVSMQDAVYPTLASNVALYNAIGDKAPPRTGNRHGGLASAPYNVYPATDGYLALICVSEPQWRGLVQVMDRPELLDDPRFGTKSDRVRNIEDLDETIGGWTGLRPRDELVSELRAVGVPCAPVLGIGEVLEDPNLRARGMVSTVDYPGVGPVPVPGTPIRYDDRFQGPARRAPVLGEDNDYVYRKLLGLPDDEMRELRAQGVI